VAGWVAPRVRGEWFHRLHQGHQARRVEADPEAHTTGTAGVVGEGPFHLGQGVMTSSRVTSAGADGSHEKRMKPAARRALPDN